jgi:phosphoglycerate dehydrogenase-like enzyme
MNVVFWPSIAGQQISARLHEVKGASVVVADDLDKFAAAAPEAEVLVIGGHFFSGDVAKVLHGRARKLRFIQTFTAGYEGLQEHGVPEGVTVANAGDSWSPAVAEHGMALLLALVKKLEPAIFNKPKHAWDRRHAKVMGSLEGMTLAIAGYGSIGREFAKFARVFGMHIVGVRRNPQPDPLVDEMRPASELKSVLGRADAILVAVPYSKATDKMFGAAEFAACKKGALLVNVARGGLIDQVALGDALRSGQLGGAAVDVTDPEPLPAESPFWDCPNLIITPHVAGASGPVGLNRLAKFIGENVARYVAGQPVTHQVTL